MTHDIPSEGRPSAVTGQPETPVASRVDERACSRPAAAAPGAAEGISAAPGISPADHPLGVETPEQAARYWQMRHAEAQIELARATRRILELQNEVAAVSKRHVDAAIETQQDLKSLTAARAEVERLKAALAEEKRLHAAAEEARRCAIATLADCHELVDQAAIPGLERDRMQSLQVRISGLIERATKPVHVAPPPADTASCEQHLQERIEELEAELKAARAEIADVHRGLDATGVYAQATTLSGQRLLSPRERIDRLTARAVELADCINAPASNVGVYGRMASAICGVTYGGIGLRCAPEAADPHPAIDSIHAALDRADVPRKEVLEGTRQTRPMTPQGRIEDLAKHRDRLKAEVSRLEGNLKVMQQTTEELIAIGAGAATRANANADLLAWLDKVGDLVVLNLRVGPVCVKRGATGAHKTLRDALEAIRASELDRVLRKETVK